MIATGIEVVTFSIVGGVFVGVVVHDKSKGEEVFIFLRVPHGGSKSGTLIGAGLREGQPPMVMAWRGACHVLGLLWIVQ